jgi:hypothetical protein
MALPIWKPRVLMLSGNNPNASTSFQVGGSAIAGYQTFVGAGYTNGQTVKYWAVAVDASEVPTGDWEHGVGTIDTAATPDEIDRPTAVLANSAGTTSKIDFSGATGVLLYVEPGGDEVALAYAATRGYKSGGGFATYNSTTAVDLSAWTLDINGELVSVAAATITSGSTMLDLAGSTVTIGASKAYRVFVLRTGAGTGAYRVEENDGTGDGATPVWDDDLNYWKAASTGATARRVWKFWTNGSSQIIKFWHVDRGTNRATYFIRSAVNVLSGGTANTYTSLTITPYSTADDESLFILPKPGVSSGTNANTNMFVSIDAGTSDHEAVQGVVAASTAAMALTRVEVPYTGTLHYKTLATNPSVAMDIDGYSHIV